LEVILRDVEVTHVDVLKIDVEGYEDKALLPFFATAPKQIWPKAIVIEHCHRDRWKKDCQKELVEIGYNLIHQDRTNLMFARKTN
jgi:hypothetical protein